MPRPKSKRRRESVLESFACKWARIRDIVVAKMTEVVGIPDRIFFVPGGKPIIIEFKAEDEVPREAQAWYIETMKTAGYRVFHCDTKEKFLKLMATFGVT